MNEQEAYLAVGNLDACKTRLKMVKSFYLVATIISFVIGLAIGTYFW